MGVLTKSDLEKPARIREFLDNNGDVQFKYGYTAVINRNKDDEKRGMSVDEKVKWSRNFFDTQEEFEGIDSKHLGTENLRNNLSKILLKKMQAAFGPIQNTLLV